MAMDDRERRAVDDARRRDEEHRNLNAVRRAERNLEHDEKALERELENVTEREERAKRDIEAEWQAEHWHHDPDRPPAWRTPPPDEQGRGGAG
jgi:hypothetical protein